MEKTLSNRLIAKLSISFLIIIVIIGLTYMFLSLFISHKFVEETTQRLNANVANHLIDEKFKDASPFLEDGTVNKPLFGDIMHNMMAVNRGIEVYLLNEDGGILYSVVLDHSDAKKPITTINLEPIKEFINQKGNTYILGDDPLNSGEKNIFSAAHYQKDGHQGYIYIVLAGKEFKATSDALFSSYFTKLGLGAIILTMIFAIFMGILSVWFLTKNLRTIIFKVNRFREGDLESRIDNAEQSDLSTLAVTFNEMADTIVKNIEEIKSVDVLRRELVANVSHDLRTPLTVMQGYIETIQIKEGSLNDEQNKEYLLIIKNSIKHLTKLVSQLFEYSKLEAKQIVPQKEPFAITDLIHDIQVKYQLIAKEKSINLTTEFVGNVPLVFADIGLVERAIQNLLDNAMKFTPNNGEISILIIQETKSVIIKIKDSGPGISLEDQKYIFERFRQVEGKQKKNGVGLGLAIVKKIIELHDTNIKIISKPNEGSTFEFYLPSYISATN